MTIDLNGNPLTIRDLHHMLYRLVTDGQVAVVNCCVGEPVEVVRLLGLSNKLSEEDKDWFRKVLQEELKPKRPWVTT